MNLPHFNTTNDTIRNLLPIKEGQIFDKTVIIESERVLQDASVRSLAVILGVWPNDEAISDGMVDLLVATRDISSLRIDQDFAQIFTP